MGQIPRSTERILVLKVLELDTVCLLQAAVITQLLTYLVIYFSVGATEYRLSQW